MPWGPVSWPIYIYIYIYIYMAASLLFTSPIDAPGGTTERTLPLHGPRPGPPPEISKRIPGLRPGIPWTEIRPASGREKKRAGLPPGPSGRERICRKNRFLHKKMTILEKLRFWCPGPPKSTSGPSFSDSPRQTIWGPEVLVQIRALRTPFVANQRSHPRRGNLLSVVRPC